MRARTPHPHAEDSSGRETRRRRSSVDAVLTLQRTIGNRAVGHLLRGPKTVTVIGGGLGNDASYETEGGDERVKMLQRSLNETERGIPEKLIVDGIYGPKSETAMRLSQWRRGEPITGRRWAGVTIETQGGGL